MSSTYVVDVIAGDGIGQEVTPAAIACVDAIAATHDYTVTWRDRDWGSDRYRSTGRMMPIDGLNQLATGDATLLGAVDAPDIPDDITLWGLLIPIRRELDKYVNLRPIRIQPGVTSPLAGLTSLDIVVVRENVEGLSKRSSGKSSSMKTAARKAVQAATRLNVWLYRRTNGRVGGSGMGGLPLLLLTVPGRRSGTPYTVPVAYFEHTGKHLVVGTGMGGSKETPQWFRNLAVAGAGRIRVRDQDHDVEARLASAAEREEFWDVIAARAPHFDKWQVRIGRSFPVAVLTPRSSPQVSEPA